MFKLFHAQIQKIQAFLADLCGISLYQQPLLIPIKQDAEAYTVEKRALSERRSASGR